MSLFEDHTKPTFAFNIIIQIQREVSSSSCSSSAFMFAVSYVFSLVTCTNVVIFFLWVARIFIEVKSFGSNRTIAVDQRWRIIGTPRFFHRSRRFSIKTAPRRLLQLKLASSSMSLR